MKTATAKKLVNWKRDFIMLKRCLFEFTILAWTRHSNLRFPGKHIIKYKFCSYNYIFNLQIFYGKGPHLAKPSRCFNAKLQKVSEWMKAHPWSLWSVALHTVGPSYNLQQPLTNGLNVGSTTGLLGPDHDPIRANQKKSQPPHPTNRRHSVFLSKIYVSTAKRPAK